MSVQVPAKLIVVADDTEFVRDRFADALRSAGHQAVTATSAPELLAQLQACLPHLDLVVLDLHLSQTGGVELVRAVRQLDGGQVPIVVFSGTVENADEARALATLGVTGYVNEYSGSQNILPALAPHLFPDNFNRRTSPRVVLGIPISFRVANTIATALTLNLSKGGLAIRTATPQSTGSKLKLRFRLPGSGRDIDADARVAWNDRRIGMGLQFERVDQPNQRAIDEFVDQHVFGGRRS